MASSEQQSLLGNRSGDGAGLAAELDYDGLDVDMGGVGVSSGHSTGGGLSAAMLDAELDDLDSLLDDAAGVAHTHTDTPFGVGHRPKKIGGMQIDDSHVSSGKAAADNEPVAISASGGVNYYGWILFLTGTLLLGSYAAMSKMAEGPDGERPVPVPIAILIMESFKFVISVGRLAVDKGGLSALRGILADLRWEHIWPYSVPGLLYMINNNTEIYILEYMDPATFRMLNNGKVLTTALLAWIVLQQKISRQQWVALAMLMAGACLVVVSQNRSEAEGGEMFVTTIGVLIIIVFCIISGIAGIANEWVMKRGTHAKNSVHLQNAILYAWGFCFNALGAVMAMRSTTSDSDDTDKNVEELDGSGEGIGPFHSMSQLVWWCLFIANGTFHGLVISFVVKYLSSVHKLFMGGTAIVVAALLQKVLLGAAALPAIWFVAAAIVFGSMYLYNTPGIICVSSDAADHDFEDV